MEFVIGIFVGALLFWLFGKRKRPSGTFIVDMADPEKDDIFKLVWDDDLDAICSKKQIILNVKVYDYDDDLA